MALKVVSMAELRREVVLEPKRTGETVTEVCRRYGISRQTYYRYRRRLIEEGLDGLEDRSRRPWRSPNQIEPELELEICRLRKDHYRWGARRIHAELRRQGITPPAVSTIHQALVRNHLVAPHPPRRSKAKRRFEREVANDLWQMDATAIYLATRKRAWIIDCLDDHSRYLLAAIACPAATTGAAWDCFELAASRYGLPRQVLTDNGLCFTGKLHGVEVAFEDNVRQLGTQLIHASPYHPETMGKIERFHRTLKEWLGEHGPAFTVDHLQEILDGFRFHYNNQRPHQGIGDTAPSERFGATKTVIDAAPCAGYDERGEPIYPEHAITRKVSAVGVVSYQRNIITVGNRYAGCRVRIIPTRGMLHVLYGNEVLRALVTDPNTKYYPLGARKRKDVT